MSNSFFFILLYAFIPTRFRLLSTLYQIDKAGSIEIESDGGNLLRNQRGILWRFG